MITNIPTKDELDDLALSLHFSAWGQLNAIERDFNETYAPDSGLYWSLEEDEYLRV
jgi:hypothetical protein